MRNPQEQSQRLQQREALLAAATAGDAEAQFQLGERCRKGDAAAGPDMAEAARWYRLAAAQGHAGAQSNVGSMYYHGMGAPKDLTEAARWYRLAADRNLPVAMFNLGMQYRDGLGVEADPVEAMRLIQAAAEGGDALAQTEVGARFRYGKGVEPDLLQAAQAFVLAGVQGEVTAMWHLSELESELQKLAMSGAKEAAWCLKEMYQKGLGVPRNCNEWRRWGKLFVTIDNTTRESYLCQMLTVEGYVEMPMWDELVVPAAGDDPYSFEWMYRNGMEADTRHTTRRLRDYLLYKAKRDAGMPPPLDRAWPDGEWRKWSAMPRSRAEVH